MNYFIRFVSSSLWNYSSRLSIMSFLVYVFLSVIHSDNIHTFSIYFIISICVSSIGCPIPVTACTSYMLILVNFPSWSIFFTCFKFFLLLCCPRISTLHASDNFWTKNYLYRGFPVESSRCQTCWYYRFLYFIALPACKSNYSCCISKYRHINRWMQY